jgi:SAM-dependent methyltransferase
MSLASSAFASARSMSEPFLLRALHEDELVALSVLLYNVGRRMRSETVEPWEAEWWSRSLPPAPARILVAACGAGREVRWLLDRGYRVQGFDPATSLVRIARERVGRAARIDVMDFAAFTAAARAAEYDAVIVGWGSFSHVLSAPARTALLAACKRTCPRGPILISWLQGAGPHTSSSLSARLGAAVGALRGNARDASGDVLYRIGVTHLYREGEVEELARAAALQFEPQAGHYPHATLTPGDATAAAARDARIRNQRALAVEALQRSVDMIARGGSMSPFIPSGSRIRVVEGAPQLGDVVAATVDGELVVHRVVGCDAAGHLLLKGDASAWPDGWVAPAEIIGKIAVVQPAPRHRVHASSRMYRALARFSRARSALDRSAVQI